MADGTRGAIAALAILASLALAALQGPMAAGDVDDTPETGPWLEDGSVVRDWVRLSADDPSADPEDWFRVNLSRDATGGDLLRVDLNLTSNGDSRYLVWAAVHDPDGALLTEVKATSYAVRSTRTLPPETGVYLIRVYTYSRFECDYRMAINVSHISNVSDGDDTLASATALEPPVNVTGHLHGERDVFDHYLVNLTRNDEYFEYAKVSLGPVGQSQGRTDLDLFLLLVDGTGRPRQVSASTSNGSEEEAFYAAAEPNTTLYIRCHAYGGITDYYLNLTKRRVADDGNNNVDSAIELADGASRNDSLNESDYLDFYKVNLTGGDILTVNVTFDGYDPVLRKPNMNIYIYTPDVVIVNWSFAYDPHERATYTVPLDEPPALHFVLVTWHDQSRSDGVPAWGNYTINVSVDHAPRLLAPLPLVVQEDDELTIALADLVEDPEGRLEEVRALPSDALVVTIDGPDLRMAPRANVSGLESFDLRLRDHLRWVTRVVAVNVTPLPDAPALAPGHPEALLEEDTTLVLNLSLLVVDGDGDVVTVSLAPTGGPHLANSTIDGLNLTIVPDPDFSGMATLTLLADDGTGPPAELALPVTVTPVQDAPRVVWPEANATATEDVPGFEFDLSPVFEEVDGDPLAYDVVNEEELEGAVTYIILGPLLVIDPAEDLSGEVVLTVRATDGAGGTALADVTIDFQEVNDPPRVTGMTPDPDVVMVEGTSRVFTVVALDPEGSGALTYEWFLNLNDLQAADLPRYELQAGYDFQGTYMLSVSVSDGDMASWANWSIEVENLNRAPTLTIIRPEEGEAFEEGSNAVFSAEAEDPDGEGTVVEWLIDGEVVGTGAAYATSDLDPGRYTLTARVTDPHNASAEATVVFKVEARDVPLPGAYMAAAALALVWIVSMVALPRLFDRLREGRS